MAANFTVDEKVFIPASRILGMEEYPYAFYETYIAEVGIRKIKVHLQGGATSEWIGSGLCQKNIGILIFTIGDLETETGLLDPLAKSILQYCRLLVPDDCLRAYKIRSLAELKHIWQKEQAAYSHVVIVGHGCSKGIKFSVDEWVKSEELDTTLKFRGLRRRYLYLFAVKLATKQLVVNSQRWQFAVISLHHFTAYMVQWHHNLRRPFWPFTFLKGKVLV